jgi:hypothetical protein
VDCDRVEDYSARAALAAKTSVRRRSSGSRWKSAGHALHAISPSSPYSAKWSWPWFSHHSRRNSASSAFGSRSVSPASTNAASREASADAPAGHSPSEIHAWILRAAAVASPNDGITPTPGTRRVARQPSRRADAADDGFSITNVHVPSPVSGATSRVSE